MNCLTPITVHKGTDKESVVPCGKCAFCRANRRAEWIARLRLELLSSDFAQFNTLTYDNDHLPYSDYVDIDSGEVICKQTALKRDVQLFLKRLRKIYPGQVRYFIISEYGDETARPHWHGLFFLKYLDLNNIDILKKWSDDFVNCWSNGNVQFAEANVATITYCTKYMFKYGRMPFGIDDLHMLCSRKPPIGSEYISRYKDYNISQKDFSRVRFLGTSARLPRLFRDKWKEEYLSGFDPEERENELSFLKFQTQQVVHKQQLKLIDEYLLNHESFNYDAFQDWLRWRLDQYKQRVLKNQSKHDKL